MKAKTKAKSSKKTITKKPAARVKAKSGSTAKAARKAGAPSRSKVTAVSASAGDKYSQSGAPWWKAHL
jgi:hypothetical protein